MINIDWKMFFHHRVILGFFFELPGNFNRDVHRIIWRWNWKEEESIINVPWQRCYCWNSCFLVTRWVGHNDDGSLPLEVWKG